MIAAAKFVTDCRERRLGVLATEVHGNLPRKSNVFGAPFCLQVAYLDIVVVADRLLNTLDSDFPLGTF